MAEQLFVAANLVQETLIYGHLQVVYEDASGNLLENEATSPGFPYFWGDWAYPDFGRRHDSTSNTPGYDNPDDYTRVPLDLRPQQTAEHVWELLGQIHSSLSAGGHGIDYDLNQNSNSYVASVLSVVGMDIDDYLDAVQPPSVEGFPGVGTNIFQGAKTGGLFSGYDTKIPLTLAGTAGADYIIAGIGKDRLDGADGHDEIHAGKGKDTVTGGNGNDSLFGGSGHDTLIGGSGEDRLEGERGADSLSGGSFADRLIGGPGDDTLDGGSDFDTVLYIGLSGAVQVNLENGTATGAAGIDTLIAVEHAFGSPHGDTLTGTNIHGNRLEGSTGADTIFGLDGRDTILGGDDNDQLLGGSDTDFLLGQSGADYLDGGPGRDLLTGGADGDNFVFSDIADLGIGVFRRDEIRDFDAAEGDVITLSPIDADANTLDNDAFAVVGSFTGTAGEMTLTDVVRSGVDVTVVNLDVTGDAVTDGQIYIVGGAVEGDFLL